MNALIAFALAHRGLMVLLAVAVAVVGGGLLWYAPIDVFPDLNRPTVTIMTEFPGRAPEEVEQLVTFPIETAMNGTTGVERVRSASGIGLSVVWVEFAWGTNVLLDQQLVAQRLQVARLPEGVKPVIAPPSSIMGEIMLVGLDAPDGNTSPMELRTLADWTIRPRILAVRGVSQVTVMGGEVRQYQVLTDPARLALHDVTLEDLTQAVQKANTATGGGFLNQKDREELIRITGRTLSLDELADTVVTRKDGVPIRVRQVADVVFAGPVKRGDSAVRVKAARGLADSGALLLAVQKQPGANTLTLDAKIRDTLGQLEAELRRTHPGIRIHTDIFRQADFIDAAIGNVLEAVRDGILLLTVVLFLFLWNFRTGLITLLVLPLPLCILGLLFTVFGMTLNTMTLGGIAIAIGDLVDDSIVDIENIYRRLRENRQRPDPLPPLRVIFEASSEVRNSIVYATLIVCLVVFPLFFLSGLEGRMFTPMGIAYIVTLMASLLVSLTITPVLASYLLVRPLTPNPSPPMGEGGEPDPFLVRWLKALARPVIRLTLRHPNKVLLVSGILVLLSLITLPFMGGQFLPPFNEGTLTINLIAPPGTSLEESSRLATQAESILLGLDEVLSTARRTGRAELDEHAENVNSTEIDVRLRPLRLPRAGWLAAALRQLPFLSSLGWEQQPGRPREEVMEDIRHRLEVFQEGGVAVNVGQPISHRLDHIMSGIRAQVAVKLFGPELSTLRAKGAEIEEVIRGVAAQRSPPVIVDLRLEPLDEIDQVRIDVLHNEAARYGRTPEDVSHLLETALRGRAVSQVIDQQRTFDVVVWYSPAARNDLDVIRATLIDTPLGRVPLRQLAEVQSAGGPVGIHRDSVQRRIAVSFNVQGGDLTGVVNAVRQAVTAKVELPPGYYLEYGGQFEAQQEATFRLWILFPLVLVGVFLLLWKAVESWRAALQVMANIPLAFLGGIVALLIAHPPHWERLYAAAWYEWPGVWISGINLSLAHWVGFITLTGIVARNGIMMIAHYIHLMRYEGEQFNEQMIVRGTLERLTPVLMTAITSIVGLFPLLLGAGETGKEILYPLAIVVTGGMISSTLLDQLVTPALFFKFGRRVYQAPVSQS
jgi:CzcA family heavy metal efflux pump